METVSELRKKLEELVDQADETIRIDPHSGGAYGMRMAYADVLLWVKEIEQYQKNAILEWGDAIDC